LKERNVELKKVKIARFMSEETTAFTAELWVDGKQIGVVKNEGRGGNNQLDPHEWTPEGHAKVREFEEWCETQPPSVFEGYSLSMNSDFFLGLLIEDYEETAMLKRRCKKHMLVKLVEHAEGEFAQYTAPYTPAFAARVKASEGDKLMEIINERFL
jgi:hypothetical protein